jgi:hypothetical protein
MSIKRRNDEQWEALVSAAFDKLVELGRKNYDATITYSALNNHIAEVTGQSPFDLNDLYDRHDLGLVLSEVNDRAHTLVGDKLLITSLVLHNGSDDLGVGFYGYARRAGVLLPGMDKTQFLIEQEKKVRDALRAK